MVVKKDSTMKAIYTGYNKEKYLPLCCSIKENTVYNIVLTNIYESKNSQNSNDNFEDHYHISVFDDNKNLLDDIIYQNFKDFSLDWIFVYDHESIEPNKTIVKSNIEKIQAIYCNRDNMINGLTYGKIYNIKISDIYDTGKSIHNKNKIHCLYQVEVYDENNDDLIFNIDYDGLQALLRSWRIINEDTGFMTDIRYSEPHSERVQRRGDIRIDVSEYDNRFIIIIQNVMINKEKYLCIYKPVADDVVERRIDEAIDELSRLSPGDYKDISPSDYDYAINHLAEIDKDKRSQFSINESEVCIHYVANNAYIKITYKDSVQYKVYCYSYEPIFGVDADDVSTIIALVTRTVYMMEREYNL